MDLKNLRKEKEKTQEKFINEIIGNDQAQRYRFASIREMSILRNAMIDRIFKNKNISTNQTSEIKDKLVEYFYVEDLEQLDQGDYLRYITFKSDIDFELKNGGRYHDHNDTHIILYSIDYNNKNEKPKYWKISRKTPVFCKLSNNDKMILVLMEKVNG